MLVLCCKAPLILQPTPCPCPYSFFMIYQFDIAVLSRAFKNISLAEKNGVSYFPELPLRLDVESCLKNRASLFCPSCNGTLNRKNVAGLCRVTANESACENTFSLCFKLLPLKTSRLNFLCVY